MSHTKPGIRPGAAWHPARAWLGALAMLLGLGACGGGGGGGGSTATADPSPPPLPLRLTHLRASGTTQTLIDDANQRIGDVTVLADVQGDLTQLNGQTLFIVVEDSAQLFQTQVSYTLNGATDNRIQLFGRSAEGRSGSYRGPLRVHVCLDAACQRPFQGSPLTLPYQIDVLPGIRIDAPAPLRIDAGFGSLPGLVTLPVSLPAGTRHATATLIGASPVPQDAPVTATLVEQPGTAVQLQGLLAPVGSQTLNLVVSGELTLNDRVQFLTRTVPLTYTVAPNPGVGGLMTPASLSLRTVASPGQDVDQASVRLLAADGQRYSQGGRVTYLPAGPDGNLDAGAMSWLQVYVPADGSSRAATGFEIIVHACRARSTPFDPVVCLAPGRYDAIVRFQTEAGTEYPAPLPVSMQVRAFAADP